MKPKETKLKSEKKSPEKYSDNPNGLEKYVLATLIVILAIVTALLISFKEFQNSFQLPETSETSCDCPRKTFQVYGSNIESGFLDNVFAVLDRLGYENDPNATDWDLLWAHNYPFRTLYPKLNNLKPHQKVNHFPGCGYITNKVDLVTSGLKYIPVAFRLPQDKDKLIEYARSNPKKQFVEKDNNHRNILIKQLEEIDLNSKQTFVQEFVDRPLLVSGYKFDVGIYTIITSIDPLRFYIYNGDALLRFCPHKYYPFDSKDVDKYIIGDDYLPPWNVPDLAYYYDTLKFSMKESLNAFLRSEKKNPDVVWDQIEDALRVVLLANEPKLIEVTERFKSKRNFFEMMRFDFVVDEDLKVYLMEANMSPNLSSAHFPPNQLLFQQIVYNLMGLVGIGEKLSRISLQERSTDEELMISSNKNIAVFPDKCSSELCRAGCVSPDCHLCQPCLTIETKALLLQAYREEMNKGDCKRIYPPRMNQQTASKSPDLDGYSAMNQLMYKWYQGKCLLDPIWCN